MGWWEKFPVPTSLPAGSVRRVDVLSMIGDTESWSPQATQALLDRLGGALDDLLAEKATRWSPATGLIDIYSGTVNKAAADLKHSIVTSTIQRCVREAARDLAVDAKTSESDVERLVAWDQFEALCKKGKVRTDQIQILDVGEALFGTPEPEHPLSRRIWREVDAILEENLAKGGYSTRYSKNRVLLYFPGYSKSMGDMKRKSIADEIARVGYSLKDKVGTDEDGAAPPAKGPAQVHKISRDLVDDDNPERIHATLAYAALLASRSADLPDPAEIELPAAHDIRPRPMWSAKKRAVVGSVLEAAHKTGNEWDRYFPATTSEPDALDLPVLARAMRQIEQLVLEGKSSLVVVPVYWPSLDRARFRDRYLAFCSRLPGGARRSLVLELAGIPEDMLTARAEERIVQLRPYCRAVIARVRLGRRDFTQFKKLPLHAVGVDMGELPDYERGIIPGFDAFMDAVEPLKLHSYAHGLNTKSLLMAVQAAGVDYVSGSVIPESGEAPLGIRDFTIADLYDTSASR
jgi:hypothetical protein